MFLRYTYWTVLYEMALHSTVFVMFIV